MSRLEWRFGTGHRRPISLRKRGFGPCCLARAIAFTDAVVGGTAAVYLPQLFKRMGIAEEVARKAKPQRSGADVAECVARVRRISASH